MDYLDIFAYGILVVAYIIFMVPFAGAVVTKRIIFNYADSFFEGLRIQPIVLVIVIMAYGIYWAVNRLWS